MDFGKLNLEDHQDLAREIIKRAVGGNFASRRDFAKFRNKIVKENGGEIFHNLYFIKAYRDLLKEGVIEKDDALFWLLQKRSVRTMSGVAPVTVLTKPFPCPGRCIYCPTDVRMPKSYLASQPAAQRGFRQQFNPYSQVFVRLKALLLTGHEVSKVELRVLGGTWSSYPESYQEWFIKMCLLAMNDFVAQVNAENGDTESSVVHGEEINTLMIDPLTDETLMSFEEVVKLNETADVRCIGINIETRPDFISAEEIARLRRFGVTKIEIGVQTTDDKVQELTKRGHDLEAVKKATCMLKDAGFKVSYHMMPNLLGATIEGDKRMVGELFCGEDYQPDYLKIYPCMVIPGTELATIYENGGFSPYNDEELEEVLYEEMKSVPEWCRVDRVARDIPADEIEAGSKKSNIRQVLEKRFELEGLSCRDIRAREIYDGEVLEKDVQLVVRKYLASGGEELFLSYEDVGADKLIALLRLRFPGDQVCLDELKGAALVREVHVYGKQVRVGKRGGEVQHGGFGSRLLADAEDAALRAGYKRMAVIAGIGTREYYKKFGYVLEGSYMVKVL